MASPAEDGLVWWAFMPRDDAGVFIPMEPRGIGLVDLPTEADLQQIARKTRRTVEMAGGAPGVVEGYMTPDAEFYVAVPVDSLEHFFTMGEA